MQMQIRLQTSVLHVNTFTLSYLAGGNMARRKLAVVASESPSASNTEGEMKCGDGVGVDVVTEGQPPTD